MNGFEDVSGQASQFQTTEHTLSQKLEAAGAMLSQVLSAAHEAPNNGSDVVRLTEQLEKSGQLPIMNFMGIDEARQTAIEKPHQDKPETQAKASVDKDFFGRVSGVHTATFDRTIKYDVFGSVSEVSTVDRESGKREVFKAQFMGLGYGDVYMKANPVTGKNDCYERLQVNNDGTISYGSSRESTKEFHDGRKETTFYGRAGMKETFPDGTSVERDHQSRVVSSTVLRHGKLVSIDYGYDERGVSELRYKNADGSKETWRNEATGWVKYDSKGQPMHGRPISAVNVGYDGTLQYCEDGAIVAEFRDGSARVTERYADLMADSGDVPPADKPVDKPAGKQTQKRVQK